MLEKGMKGMVYWEMTMTNEELVAAVSYTGRRGVGGGMRSRR